MDFSLSDNEITLHYSITPQGRDWKITVCGGDAHIGSVSMVIDGEVITCEGNGHRDSFLTKPLAEALKSRSQTIVVMGGFHLDNITKEQIQRVLILHEKGIAKILEYME